MGKVIDLTTGDDNVTKVVQLQYTNHTETTLEATRKTTPEKEDEHADVNIDNIDIEQPEEAARQNIS